MTFDTLATEEPSRLFDADRSPELGIDSFAQARQPFALMRYKGDTDAQIEVVVGGQVDDLRPRKLGAVLTRPEHQSDSTEGAVRHQDDLYRDAFTGHHHLGQVYVLRSELGKNPQHSINNVRGHRLE